MKNTSNRGFTLYEVMLSLVVITFILLLSNQIIVLLNNKNITNDTQNFHTLCHNINLKLNEHYELKVTENQLYFKTVFDNNEYYYAFVNNKFVCNLDGRSGIFFDNVTGRFYQDGNLIYIELEYNNKVETCTLYLI